MTQQYGYEKALIMRCLEIKLIQRWQVLELFSDLSSQIAYLYLFPGII